MNYYLQKQFLAAVDKKDNLIGQIEKWQAHKRGVLHRGFTVMMFFQDQIILQQRKHLAFDGYLDLSFSSHPIYKNNILQDNLKAVSGSLKREWGIENKDLINKPKLLEKIYYKAEDIKSKFVEHEIDYVFSVRLKKIPQPNLNFAYGFLLVKRGQILNKKFLSKTNFAPWVKEIIKESPLKGLSF